MNYQNDDLRIKEINELLPPVALLKKVSRHGKCSKYRCSRAQSHP